MAFKKEKPLPFATAWMEFEDIMLSEISQTEKTDTVWFHLHGMKVVVSHMTRARG